MEVPGRVLVASMEAQNQTGEARVGADNEAKIVFDQSKGINHGPPREVVIGLPCEREHSTRVPVLYIPAYMSEMFPGMTLIISIRNS